MNNTETKTEIIQHTPIGTCCKEMQIGIADGIIQNVHFAGGCPGNLIGIQHLVKGMHIDEVIAKFSGITCGEKRTSCPDQLALCLKKYKEQN